MTVLPVKKRERTGGGELSRFHEEMDELISSFFQPWESPLWRTGRWPALDITEKEDHYLVKAEVPGCKAEDIDISVHGNTLTISGEKKEEEEVREKGYYRSERVFGSFRRDLSLAAEVDPNKIEATCKEGVLEIKVPKSEKAKPIKVKVKG
ncbi:MAG TPA: Hsp20/alpha crystallin family protein [Anaerohalosphaeraceae bacterium]|jgi:HSP20 family protein|nr:Hsp20/alpha crystallin family protein [Anaerohalosphaeraceae bacterium]HRT50492.1 Hsp20/alpha crystallin family protein [Anaerohalosphaeraceae bacterium]HRT86422.1 Hsp20/alpha crystallin family protein [Anaerohalosphaeraceae bacterium]